MTKIGLCYVAAASALVIGDRALGAADAGLLAIGGQGSAEPALWDCLIAPAVTATRPEGGLNATGGSTRCLLI